MVSKCKKVKFKSQKYHFVTDLLKSLLLIQFFVKHLLWYQMEAEIKLYNHENSVGHKSGLK